MLSVKKPEKSIFSYIFAWVSNNNNNNIKGRKIFDGIKKYIFVRKKTKEIIEYINAEAVLQYLNIVYMKIIA